MTVHLTDDLLGKMFRCPDCITDPPVEVEAVTLSMKRIRTLHDPSCVRGDNHRTDAAVRIQSQIAYMPYEVDDDDPALSLLEGKA